jgi:hypothetical protein
VDAANGGHIEVVDLSEPATPYSRSILQVSWQPYDIVAQNNLIFVASPDSGIRILNSTNPDSLFAISSALSLALAISMNEDTLFAVADSGLAILNVSTPSDPKFIGAATMPGGRVVADIAVANDLAYMCWNRVYVADARDRSSPVHTGTIGESWSIAGLFASGDTIFATGRGLWVLGRPIVTTVSDPTRNNFTGNLTFQESFPNPFNSSTQIRYSVAQKAEVELTVYDILGRRVETLAKGFHEPGEYIRVFRGDGISSGVYVVVVSSNHEFVTSKILLLK